MNTTNLKTLFINGILALGLSPITYGSTPETKEINPWEPCKSYCSNQLTEEKESLISTGIKTNNLNLVKLGVSTLKPPLGILDAFKLNKFFVKEGDKGIDCNPEILETLSSAGAQLNLESLSLKDKSDWKLLTCANFFSAGFSYLKKSPLTFEAAIALFGKINEIKTGFSEAFAEMVKEMLVKTPANRILKSSKMSKFTSEFVNYINFSSSLFVALIVNQPNFSEDLEKLATEKSDRTQVYKETFGPIYRHRDVVVSEINALPKLLQNEAWHPNSINRVKMLVDHLFKAAQSDLEKQGEEYEKLMMDLEKSKNETQKI